MAKHEGVMKRLPARWRWLAGAFATEAQGSSASAARLVNEIVCQSLNGRQDYASTVPWIEEIVSQVDDVCVRCVRSKKKKNSDRI